MMSFSILRCKRGIYMNNQLYFRFVKLYFRDKMGVFYSLLGAIVVILLYFLFLANNQIELVKQQVSTVGQNEVSYLVHSLILAGLLSITSVTSVLGAYSTMVSDWENHIMMDFRSSPLKTISYPLASVLSAWTIGILMSGISFIIYQFGIYWGTGYYFTILQNIITFGLILFTSLFSALFFGAICSVIRSTQTFSGVSLLTGTLIGFFNGLYVPIMTLAEEVRKTLVLLPFIHISALYRTVLCTEAQKVIFKGAPQQTINSYRETVGIDLNFGNFTISQFLSISYLLLVSAISFVILIVSWKRKEKEI